MSGGARLLGWAMVLLWLTWGLALEGWLAARPAIALWVPNLGLLFFLAIGARLGRKPGQEHSLRLFAPNRAGVHLAVAVFL